MWHFTKTRTIPLPSVNRSNAQRGRRKPMFDIFVLGVVGVSLAFVYLDRKLNSSCTYCGTGYDSSSDCADCNPDGYYTPNGYISRTR